MKFLKALQEGTGNNFTYLVPMNKVRIYMQQRGDTLSRSKVSPHPPPLLFNPHVYFHFYVMIKGLRRAWSFEVSESPSRGRWKQFLLSRPYEHRIYMQQRGTLYTGMKCPPHLNPHVCFHFYVMIKGLRRSWLFEVSESPSGGYWKQYLLSHPYEHSQNLHAAERDTLLQGKVPPPPPPTPQPSCMLSFLCCNKGIENSLVI